MVCMCVRARNQVIYLFTCVSDISTDYRPTAYILYLNMFVELSDFPLTKYRFESVKMKKKKKRD